MRGVLNIAKVIETNLTLKADKTIIDHQSRVIEVDSWDEYVGEIKLGVSKIRKACIGYMTGTSLPRNANIHNLKVNEYHLSCYFTNGLGKPMAKLAYLINE